MKLETISIETLLSSVKLTLRSFDEAGLLNDEELIKHAEWVINRLGIGMMEETSLILDVENYKADVPYNFKYLDFLYRCDKNETKGDHVRYFYGKPHTFQIQDFAKKICYNKCCIEEDITEITRTIVIDGFKDKSSYGNKRLLKLSKSVKKDRCTPTCINLHCESDEYFDMDQNNFFLNFETGELYLNYIGSRVDEDGYPLVIDDPYITKAIEDYLIYKGLQTIYYNSEVDVLQRLQLAKAEHEKSLKEALFVDKLPEYKRMIKYAKLRAKSIEIFNLPSIADYHADRKQPKRDYTRYK